MNIHIVYFLERDKEGKVRQKKWVAVCLGPQIQVVCTVCPKPPPAMWQWQPTLSQATNTTYPNLAWPQVHPTCLRLCHMYSTPKLRSGCVHSLPRTGVVPYLQPALIFRTKTTRGKSSDLSLKVGTICDRQHCPVFGHQLVYLSLLVIQKSTAHLQNSHSSFWHIAIPTFINRSGSRKKCCIQKLGFTQKFTLKI